MNQLLWELWIRLETVNPITFHRVIVRILQCTWLLSENVYSPLVRTCNSFFIWIIVDVNWDLLDFTYLNLFGLATSFSMIDRLISLKPSFDSVLQCVKHRYRWDRLVFQSVWSEILLAFRFGQHFVICLLFVIHPVWSVHLVDVCHCLHPRFVLQVI